MPAHPFQQRLLKTDIPTRNLTGQPLVAFNLFELSAKVPVRWMTAQTAH